MSALKSTARVILNAMPASVICKIEYTRQDFSGFNERPVEYAFVFRQLAALYPRTVLDVGTGTTALPHLMRNTGCIVTASDNVKDYWPSGMSNRHYHVINDDVTNSTLQERFDLITCVSVLEHIPNHQAAIATMFRLLNPNGHLVLTCPYSEDKYRENVYALSGSNAFGKQMPFATQSFSRRELTGWLLEHGGTIVEQEYWRFWDGDHWSVGQQIVPPIKTTSNDKHQLTCLLIRKTEQARQVTSDS